MRILAVGCFPAWGEHYGGPMRASGLLEAFAQIQLEKHGSGNGHAPDQPPVIYVFASPELQPTRSGYPAPGCQQVEVCVAEERNKAEHLPRDTSIVSAFDLAVAFGGPQCFPSLAQSIQELSTGVDLIWCFQPYAFPYVEHLGIPIVVDAMDVEHDVKAQGALGDQDPRLRCLEQIRALERRALQNSSGITILSPEDSARLQYLYGIPASRMHHVGNGTTITRPHCTTREDRESAREQLGLKKSMGTVLYFSSAHPPNVKIGKWIIEELSHKLPDVTFLIAGTICWSLQDGSLQRTNVVKLPQVKEEHRQLLYNASDVGLNPVMEPLSGSDIKVLDYLSNAVPVVATSRGVRGHGMTAGLHYYPMEMDPAGAIFNVLNEEHLAIHLAHNGLAHSRTLNYANQAARASEFFGELLQKIRSGNPHAVAPLGEPQQHPQSLYDYATNTPTTNAGPTEICLDLTNDCHLRCLHCYRTYLKNNPSYMPLEVIDRIPASFFLNARQVELSGMGEPMLHPQWDEILERITHKGPQAQIWFNTSLTVYTADRLRRMVELGTSPAISVDAARPETFEMIRARAKHEKVFGGIRQIMANARAIQNPAFSLRIQWTLYNANVAELWEFMAFAGEEGIPEVRVQPLAPHQPQMQQWCCDIQDPQTIDWLCKAFQAATEQGVRLTMHSPLLVHPDVVAAAQENHRNTTSSRRCNWHHHPNETGCSFPWTQMNIDSAGYLVACCFSDARFGNVLKDDLEMLWNGFRMGELRSEVNRSKVARWCVDSPSAGACCPRVQHLKAMEGKSHFLQEKLILT
ncbi:MAG: radical SAM protein [Candidatus Sumerlaeia bacterium]|nr:radical SAM protein [Candidatus Sumerlaeia bacterium]